ncbi:MAG: hypothetical protein HY208_00925 [Nitrospirae bacterium]|nr:hypothetical protein [Nitrospirota bacterium]
MFWNVGATISGVLLLLSLMTAAASRAAEPSVPPVAPPPLNDIFVSRLAIDSNHPNTIYVVTTYSIGLLKSADGGAHWALMNNGIKSYSLYHFAVHPKQPDLVYLGAGGGGLYKSTDGGGHWIEMNDGLQDTDIGQMFLHPNDPERIYVVTATGVHRSPDGGRTWERWNQGDDFTTSQEFQSIIIVPGRSDRLFLASKRGLYMRAEGDPSWRLASKDLEGKLISALAVDPNGPNGRRLYAAVLRDGQTLLGGGLYISDDGGAKWKRVGAGIEKDWIRVIRLDPKDSKRVYLATSNRGVLASSDGGESWKEANAGLTATDIRTLELDPSSPKILYAGAHGEGVFKSTDGAAHWTHLGPLPTLDHEAVIARLTTPDPAGPKPKLTPPPAFAKCNKCHGWTDPYLNTVHGFWLVTPNRRNWSLTVKRMSRGANLTPEEEKTIADFLQRYSEVYGHE